MRSDENEEEPISHKTLWAMRVPVKHYSILRDLLLVFIILISMTFGFGLLFGLQWVSCKLTDEDATLTQCFRPMAAQQQTRRHR